MHTHITAAIELLEQALANLDKNDDDEGNSELLDETRADIEEALRNLRKEIAQ